VRPLDLRRLDRLRWEFQEAATPLIAARLDEAPHRSLLAPAQALRLTALDPRSFRAGMVGIDMAGVRRR
jgi:hypothetical protein